jgi:hypothetical protein
MSHAHRSDEMTVDFAQSLFQHYMYKLILFFFLLSTITCEGSSICRIQMSPSMFTAIQNEFVKLWVE